MTEKSAVWAHTPIEERKTRERHTSHSMLSLPGRGAPGISHKRMKVLTNKVHNFAFQFIAVLFWIYSTQVALGQDQASGPGLRSELAQINIRGATNIDEYLSKCEQVRPLLPQLRSFYTQGAATIARIESQNAGKPDIVRLSQFLTALNGKDQEDLVLVDQEMHLASQMARLDVGKREAFFIANIRPLQRREDRLAEQEVQMAVDARNRGVPLPDDIVKATASRK